MYVLDPEQYSKVSPFLSKVEINHLFARTIVEKHLPGKVFVDDTNSPTAFLVLHPYGMSLLFGETDHTEFNSWARDYMLNSRQERLKTEWMQVFPKTWSLKLEQILGNRLVKGNSSSHDIDDENVVLENTRVNFRFNPETFLSCKQNNLVEKTEIVKMDQQLFDEFDGAVVPKYFWKDAGHFLSKGVAFCTMKNGKPASVAFTAYHHGNQLEMGIETAKAFRGKGLAIYACAALIDYCLENNLEPVWGCRMENTASYKLAQKLGFEPTRYIPYYRLVK